jgi:hypothetical protein
MLPEIKGGKVFKPALFGGIMSQADLTVLQCPKCGNSQQVMVWSSINIGVNPELKEKVMHLDFNLFE